MTHNTALAAERTAPSTSPLQPLPDQRATWRSPAKPMAFDAAAQLVLDAHLEDGERSDIVANQIRSWAFGSDDGSTMALAPLPLPGRDRLGTYPIRDLAFSQLCQRIGAPSSYLKVLPAKLQMANLNWGLARQESPALLRLAGNEIRAIVSERYAALDDELVLNMVADCLDRSGYGDDAMVRAISTGPHSAAA